MIRTLLLVAFVAFGILSGFGQNTSSAFLRAGIAKAERGDDKGAIKCYNIALEYDSSNANAYMDRGVSEVALGQFTKAKKDFDRAIKLAPTDATIYFDRANGLTIFQM